MLPLCVCGCLLSSLLCACLFAIVDASDCHDCDQMPHDRTLQSFIGVGSKGSKSNQNYTQHPASSPTCTASLVPASHQVLTQLVAPALDTFCMLHIPRPFSVQFNGFPAAKGTPARRHVRAPHAALARQESWHRDRFAVLGRDCTSGAAGNRSEFS